MVEALEPVPKDLYLAVGVTGYSSELSIVEEFSVPVPGRLGVSFWDCSSIGSNTASFWTPTRMEVSFLAL